MNSIQTPKPQRGFFDLGISVLVLALAGGVIYGVESSHAEPRAVAATATNAQSVTTQTPASDGSVVAEASR